MEFSNKSRLELIDELIHARQELDSLKSFISFDTSAGNDGSGRPDHAPIDRMLYYMLNSPIGIVEWDSDFIVTRWSGNSENIFGWSAVEALGKSVMDLNLLFEPDLPFVQKTMEKLLSGKETRVTGTNRNIRKDGKIIYCVWYNTVMPDDSGKMRYFLSQVVDVSAQRQTEEERIRREELLDLMGRTALVGGWMLNAETMEVTWTREVYLLHELEFSFIPDVYNGVNFYAPWSRPLLEEAVQKSLTTGEPFDLELEFFTAHGNKRWVHTIGQSFRENGKITYLFGSFQDITKAKQSELRIKELNENLEARIAERTRELEKMNLDLASEIGAKNALNESLKVKTAELLTSEKKYRRLVETVNEVIFQVDTSGKFTYMSPKIEKYLGYKPEEMMGKMTFDYIHPEDIPVIRKALTGLRVDEIAQFEYRYLAKNGRIGWMRTSTSFLVENEVIIGRTGSLNDITRQKEYEEEINKARRQMEEALEEARQANRAKTEFLSRMSHELRTPLNAILGFAQILKMGELNNIQRKGVLRIMEGGNRLLDLINDVLDITRLDMGNLRIVNESFRVCEIFPELLDYIQVIADNRGVSVKIDDAPGYDVTLVNDRKRLLQVLKNLVLNAVKFNRSGGTVTLRTGVEERNGGRQYLRILVEDTGIGIRGEDMKKLFKPFETIEQAQADAGGTGLGLAVVKKLTEAMGGTAGAESVHGEGSTFWIELPI